MTWIVFWPLFLTLEAAPMYGILALVGIQDTQTGYMILAAWLIAAALVYSKFRAMVER